MKKIALLSLACMFTASFAYAQSSDDLQIQLNALLQQLAQLQAQYQTQTGTANTAPAATAGGTYGQCPTLTRNLRQGASGSDVTALQAFLAADSRIYPEGTISGFFGGLTQAAVQRFQARHGIVSSGSPDTTGYGAVGPATRAAIRSVCGGGGTIPTTGSASCSVGTQTLSSGNTIQLFSVQTAPAGTACGSYAQTRQCINGVLSGNATYQYTSCSDPSNSACILSDGTTVTNNTSVAFYSRLNVSSSQSCNDYAQTRTCTNGTLSGSSSYRYTSCNAETPDPCIVDGVTIPHGSSRTFYSVSAATSSNSCSTYALTRSCNDGDLAGDSSYNKLSCSAGACMIDGLTIPNGSSTTLYFAQNIGTNEQCSSYGVTRTCSSGTLSGNTAYKYATCARVPAGTCVLDSKVVQNGSTATFFSTSTAAAGTSCSSVQQSRTCTNGTLSGTASFNRASCSDTASCTLDGVTVPHGDSFQFFSAASVAFDRTCSSVSQVRSCSNGKLSGTTAYKYSNCVVNPPVSFLPQSAQLAAALSALDATLQSILDAWDSWF